jgi:hypothetical protein
VYIYIFCSILAVYVCYLTQYEITNVCNTLTGEPDVKPSHYYYKHLHLLYMDPSAYNVFLVLSDPNLKQESVMSKGNHNKADIYY